MQIPSIPDLIISTGNLGYNISQPNNEYTIVHLNLDANYKALDSLVVYALLNMAGLVLFNRELATQNPDFSELNKASWDQSINALEKKGPNNYQGWVGEMITDFVLRHFLYANEGLMGYKWWAIDPPKGDVNNHGLDIIAAYVLQNDQVGHICGEIKTYNNFSQAKNDAYTKLAEAYNYSNNREAEIRRSLTSLFHLRKDINPIQAARAAMGQERSFLPSVLHNAKVNMRPLTPFHDLPSKFVNCTRPTQRIGICISILAISKSAEDFNAFFREFIKRMRIISSNWATQR